MRTGLRKRVQDEYNVTVNVDGWDDASGKSVYTSNTVFTKREAQVWDSKDFSAEKHTADNITGKCCYAGA